MSTLTTVSSNYGTINGIQKDGYSVFRGIPFAKVPTGALRFAPPQKRKSSMKLMMRLLSVPSQCSISPTRMVYIRKNSMTTRTFIFRFLKTVCI